jgi:hypothetical protein
MQNSASFPIDMSQPVPLTHAEKMSQVDRRYYAGLAARDRVTENRKNRTIKGNVVANEEIGTVAKKLAKIMGGKSAQRTIKHERRLGRETPDALKVFVVFKNPVTGELIREVEAVRGRDFVLLRPAKGEPSLVLDDGIKEFRVEHSADFAETLLP